MSRPPLERTTWIDMLRSEVVNANHLTVQTIPNNARTYIRTALSRVEQSNELDAAADAALRAVLSFAEMQRQHLYGDRSEIDAGRARALNAIDRLVEALTDAGPSSLANALGV